MRQYIYADLATLMRERIRKSGGQVTSSGDGLRLTVNGASANLPRQDAQTASRTAQNR